MIKKITTIEEATREWVNGFNAISSSLIERAFRNDIDNWIELTSLFEGQELSYLDTTVRVIEINGSDITVSYEGKFDEFSYFDDEGNEVEIEDTSCLFIGDDIQYTGSEFNGCGLYDLTITNYDSDNITVEFTVDKYDLEGWESDSWLPCWDTLWNFDNRCDEEWARRNPEVLAACGFRAFEDQETGDVFIGIDGGGYDFYEHHWIPLYKARGLQWHTEE